LHCSNLQIKESQEKRIFCPYCLAIKHRSKRFTTIKALSWHVTHHHKTDAKYFLDVSREDVLKTIAHVEKAFALGMLRP